MHNCCDLLSCFNGWYAPVITLHVLVPLSHAFLLAFVNSPVAMDDLNSCMQVASGIGELTLSGMALHGRPLSLNLAFGPGLRAMIAALNF